MEEELSLYGAGVEWIGQRPINTVGNDSPDWELMYELWLGVKDESPKPIAVEKTSFTVTAVQRVRILEEPVAVALFYSLDEWIEEEEPRKDFTWFMVGDGFLQALELAKEWGFRL